MTETLVRPAAPAAPRGQAGTVLRLFMDLVAPLALYYGLHGAGVAMVPALVLGGVPPAAVAVVDCIRFRRLDGLAVAVVASVALSAGVALVGGGPRFLLAREGLLTAAWGGWLLLSLRRPRPLTFRFTRPVLEGRRLFDPATRRWEPPTGESWDAVWERSPRFRRIWRTTTLLWGGALLVDAALRVLLAYTLPLGIAPGAVGGLWPATFVALQVITNVYFLRAGFWQVLLGGRVPADRD